MQIIVRGRRCILIDTSSSGTYLGDECCEHSKEAPVKQLDTVELAGVLRLRTHLFADESGLTAIRLDRVNNWPKHHYVLLPLYAMLGAANENTIVVRGANIEPFAAAVFASTGGEHHDEPQFKIVSLSEDSQIAVAGQRLKPMQVAALQRETEMSIGDTTFQVT